MPEPLERLIERLEHARSEEHTSELQSRQYLVCRLLLEGYGAHRDLHSFPPRRPSDPTPIPPEGAIDEAVETAKAFCGADAPGFVNGILAAVLRAGAV